MGYGEWPYPYTNRQLHMLVVQSSKIVPQNNGVGDRGFSAPDKAA